MPAVTDTSYRGAERRHIAVEGAVQGVGFRPFIYRLAKDLGLAGWVQNTGEGVSVEIQGRPCELERFVERLRQEKPSLACMVRLAVSSMAPESGTGLDDFRILPSGEGARRVVSMLPDVATCPECLEELWDPTNRRHRYPFTACTHCGPRYSILEGLPFDRANTTMKCFPMCRACREEYSDPGNRRFHAQIIACATCGPQLALWDRNGSVLAEREDALQGALRYLGEGKIVAVKGIGGFHLMVDAGWEQAVARLRRRKQRDAKPLAVMFPTLAQIESLCKVDAVARDLLRSPECPIVLLSRQSDAAAILAPSVAPDNPNLGVLLPYTPLHHLLLAEYGRPLVATSGNLSEEPICIEEGDALTRLGAVADVFLVHDRPIVRHVDDSVVRVIMGRELVLRRARGYAPLPIRVATALPSVLAVGGHMKSTVAFTVGSDVFTSQHIGDLGSPQAFDAFQRVVVDFERLYQQQPVRVARDMHPDYRSTRYAETQSAACAPVQHHVAHVLACLADNDTEAPCLGVSWDGTGHGPDGTIWGGEWFVVRDGRVRRVASLRQFRLPGGERAVEEPRRTALGLLFARYGVAALDWVDLPPVQAFAEGERRLLATMLDRGLNAPLTSSVGRLFDGIAALLGLPQVRRFEGEAAMALEHAAADSPAAGRYAFTLDTEPQGPGWDGQPRLPLVRANWADLLDALLADRRAGCSVADMAARFHHALAALIVDVARLIGEENVALTGGCFQNRYLAEGAIRDLRAAGFNPLWHRRIPPNDGGLAIGQAVAVARGLDMVD
ncbi:MAG: carbamoyltransferase HypF [Lentisphaerae bacterium]|nr:carbamoyltransferase HypF [Lentisphaerota bacterium]